MDSQSRPVRRFGRRLGLRPEREEEYLRHHAAVWPEVLEALARAHIRNYTIFLKDHTLFAYFEYAGEDFDADMAALSADAKMREWWSVMEPMQVPETERAPNEWWTEMREVFHMG